MNDHIKGMPFEHLIGAPLVAICDGQAMLARATRDFIEEVGLNDDNSVRMIDFSYQRPENVDLPDGNIETQLKTYTVSVPFISIVSVPNLQIDQASIDFTMEVKSSASVEKQQRKPAPLQAAAPGTEHPQTAAGEQPHLPVTHNRRPQIVGSVSKQDSKTATTYKVSLTAKDAGVPEGLSRLMDILHRGIAPVEQEDSKE